MIAVIEVYVRVYKTNGHYNRYFTSRKDTEFTAYCIKRHCKWWSDDTWKCYVSVTIEEIELPLTLLTEQEKLLRNRKASDCMVFIYKYFFPQWKDFTYCWILLLWARTEGCV